MDIVARIYVSSTFEDLKDYREKVRVALRQMGHEDIAIEYYVAEDKRPLDKCLEDVASCDLYIGIFAWRYGYVPDGYDKSITELEYRKAVETGKKCLIFLLNEEVPWPIKFVDRGKNEKRVRALKTELSKEKTVSFFKSADELASFVGPAVHIWENERRILTLSRTANQKMLSGYNPSRLPDYPDMYKSNDMESIFKPGADLEGLDLREYTMASVNLTGAIMDNVNLGGVNLIESNLVETKLVGAHLEGANLRKAHLERANLAGSFMENTDLRGANLREAYLEDADLRGASMINANLKGAYLEDADLSGADLTRAILMETDFKRTNLERANLKGTIDLTFDQLSQVKTLYNTKLDEELLIPLKEKYPNLFENPEDE